MRTPKKIALRLSRETLRRLDPTDLRAAAGGTWPYTTLPLTSTFMVTCGCDDTRPKQQN